MSEPTGPTPNPFVPPAGQPPQPGYPQQGVPYPPAQQPPGQPPYPYPGYGQPGYPPPGHPRDGAGPHPSTPRPPEALGSVALKLALVALLIALVSIASVGIWTIGAIAVAGAAVGVGMVAVNRPGAKGPAVAGLVTGAVAMLLAGGLSAFVVADTDDDAGEVVTVDPGTDDEATGNEPTGDDAKGDDDVTSGLADVLAPQGALANGGVPVGASGIAGAEVPADAVVVDVYLDYMCPYCAMFESINAATLAELRADGTVVVVYHPVSILDRLSMGTGYSTRAATAAALVADQAPDTFDAFNTAMFANQPGESTEGLTDAAIADIAVASGVPEEVAATIASSAYLTGDGSFVPWVTAATQQAALDLGRLATPTIVIDGETFAGDWSAPGVLADAVDAAKG